MTSDWIGYAVLGGLAVIFVAWYIYDGLKSSKEFKALPKYRLVITHTYGPDRFDWKLEQKRKDAFLGPYSLIVPKGLNEFYCRGEKYDTRAEAIASAMTEFSKLIEFDRESEVEILDPLELRKEDL